MGTRGLTTPCFLSEELYAKTRLQFDERAKHLQTLESATRRAVCASVKEFNKSQVGPGPCLKGGKLIAAPPGRPHLLGPRLSPFTASHHEPQRSPTRACPVLG